MLLGILFFLFASLFALIVIIATGGNIGSHGDTRINIHGLKYRFSHTVGKWYDLSFYDEDRKKWVYVMGIGIDFDWYGTQFDYVVYEKASYGSDRNNQYTINWYRTIEQVYKENENTEKRVIQINKEQDIYYQQEQERKKKEGYY